MLIDGKKIAHDVQLELSQALQNNKNRRSPCLAVIIVGEHPPSLIYIARKTKACAEVGIRSIRIALPSNISEKELLQEIEKLNQNSEVDGILLQLPLPAHLNPNIIIEGIHPQKDVDGLHPLNVGKLLIGKNDGFAPCTPLGVKVLMERSHIDPAGKNVLILGRSNLVGKPLAAILMQNAPGANATVTIAHSKTPHLKELSMHSDIVIAAIGSPLFVKADMVKEGAVVIDVGINQIKAPTTAKGYAIVGDVDFDNVQSKCSFITPVPGGVGPMTIAMLLSNTVKAWESQGKAESN